MIGSSGRRGLQENAKANGTVLDVLPVGQIISVAGLLLVALFTLIKPEASHGLGLPARILFWTLHVGAGLAALWVASRWLATGKLLPNHQLAAILITGFTAVLLAAPVYLWLDAVYSTQVIDIDPDDPASSGLMRFWPVQLVMEIAELVPWFLVSWILINLPVLLPSAEHNGTHRDILPTPIGGADDIQPSHEGSREHAPVLTDEPKPVSVPSSFLSSLPGIVGTDVVTVASDLHYLNVWTVAGRTTVLGNLRDVALELGDQGMLVHRSHWVAHAHVRRVVGTASSATCLLSNELRVPISRRRWKTVREQYGRGVVHASDDSG